ncbi:hypothetical protein [Corynebacterium urealyticum]|uniref:hypothetical protein n=1 Tax=Corynebacterium urealyticum TaxID=43771 RepID=UPI00293F67D5|nr:hypothetical protein [Corynebacterium urealyticum]WOH93774.1 hypothetical protein RZ943_06605 [Corynebacterium urealyticum]
MVQLWADINTAAIETIRARQPTSVGALTFTVESGIMFIRLPSGRRLAYVKPKLSENRFGGTAITHEGITTGRKWGQLGTYGGNLTENIVQAVARDLLSSVCTRSIALGTGSSFTSMTRSWWRPPLPPWTRSAN